MTTQKACEEWVEALLHAHNIRTVKWNDGSVGLLNVPGKWCAVVADLTLGLVHLAAGDPLPKLLTAKRGGGRVR